MANIITIDTPHLGSALAKLWNVSMSSQTVAGLLLSFGKTCQAYDSTNKFELLQGSDGGPGLIEELNYEGSIHFGVSPTMNTVPVQAVADFFSGILFSWTLLTGESDDIVPLDSQAFPYLLFPSNAAPFLNTPFPHEEGDPEVYGNGDCWIDPTRIFPMLHNITCLGALSAPQTQIEIQLEKNNWLWVTSWTDMQSPISLDPGVEIKYSAVDNGYYAGASLSSVRLWRAPDNNGQPGPWALMPTEPDLGSTLAGGSFTDKPSVPGTYWYDVDVLDSLNNEAREPVWFKVTFTSASSTTYTLTVNSSNPSSGVGITVSPADNSGSGGGTTSFSLTYNQATQVTLTAPATAGGNSFSSWTGCDQAPDIMCTVTLTANRIVTANYTSSATQTAHFSYAQVTLGSGFQGFHIPLGVAVDGESNVFVADSSNNVVKEILAAGGYTSVRGFGGFDRPYGVAADGSGNVFVADYGNGAVKEVLAAGGYTTVNTLVGIPSIGQPYGVAVDGSGNVFVADFQNNAVKEILAAGGYTTVNTLVGDIGTVGVAVDGSENVFVADYGNSAVKEILAVGGYTTVNTLGSGFNRPWGVAVDGSGNVFVSDTVNNAVKEILAAGGYATVNTLGGGFNSPAGVALDASGNVFVADAGNNRVVELAAGAINFGTITIGQPSATIPLTFTFDTDGTLGSSAALTGGAAGLDFADVKTGTCVVGAYSAGATCTVNVTFTPKFVGLRHGTAVLKDGSGNIIATAYIYGTGASASGSTTATLSSISVTPASATIPAGGTQQFTASGTLSDSSTLDLTGLVGWTSSNTQVATINATGVVTTMAAGSAYISASLNGVISNTAVLTVVPGANTTVTGEWVWMGGSNIAGATDVYGSLGVPAPGDVPGARAGAVSWTDSSGNLWLFGGIKHNNGYGNGENDLWEFSPSTNEWTWVSGGNQPGVYGTLGVPDAANLPPGRSFATGWVDGSGKLWLFGGLDFYDTDSNTFYFNDLWNYNPATKEWTWESGNSGVGNWGSWGTQGVTNSTNVPSGRELAVSWIDDSGNLWLFGGFGESGYYWYVPFSDLWKYNPATNQWTWVSGTNQLYGGGDDVYGTQGVPAVDNIPGARMGAASWTDSSGNFWLFGGWRGWSGYQAMLNDLWKYNPSTNEWTWMSGANTTNQPGGYGTQSVPAPVNVPGARYEAVSWTDSYGNYWLFGGYGYDSAGNEGSLNDLWQFNPRSKTWTWVTGSTTSTASGVIPGVYGVRGIPAPANVPGARTLPVSWTDNNGSLWLFGGAGNDSTANGSGYLNDLWEFRQFTGTLSSITVTPASASIPVGSTQQFTATGTYSDSNTQKLTGTVVWTSSNTQVATINATGVVTTMAAGSTYISASLNGINSNTAALVVVSGAYTATSLGSSSNPSSYGQTVTITATVIATSGTATPTGTVQFSVDGSAVGSAVILSGGTATYTTSTLAVGMHSITAVYTPTTGSAFIASNATALSQTINHVTPSITWTTPGAISYGTALSTMQLNASSTVAGTYAYSPLAGTVLTAGPHTLSVTFTPTDTTDYTTVTQTVLLTVNKATPAITWATPSAITYGTALSATQLNASSTVAGTFAYTPASGTVLNAGPHTLSVTFTPTDTTNYTMANASVTLMVNPATLTVTANNTSRAVGAANPTFTASYSGFVNGDTSAVLGGSPSLTTTATTSSAAGTYPITAAVGTLMAANYSFTFANGTLSVVAAPSVSITTTSTLTGSHSAGYTLTITIQNTGTGPVPNLVLSAATLGTTSGSPLPQTWGTVAAGKTATFTLAFPGSVGADGAGVAEKYSGTYTGGSFSTSLRSVTLP